LYSSRVNYDGEDKLWWSPSHKGKFDVRSFYKALACKEAIHFPWKSNWRTKVPLKVAFFAEDPYFGQSQEEAGHSD
jgi:hypothetical protein